MVRKLDVTYVINETLANSERLFVTLQEVL